MLFLCLHSVHGKILISHRMGWRHRFFLLCYFPRFCLVPSKFIYFAPFRAGSPLSVIILWKVNDFPIPSPLPPRARMTQSLSKAIQPRVNWTYWMALKQNRRHLINLIHFENNIQFFHIPEHSIQFSTIEQTSTADEYLFNVIFPQRRSTWAFKFITFHSAGQEINWQKKWPGFGFEREKRRAKNLRFQWKHSECRSQDFISIICS